MPRIKPLAYEEAYEKTRKAWDELRPAPGGPTQSPGVEHNLFRTEMYNPELFRVHSPFVQYLKNSTNLPVRHRELAIMRSAWLGGVDDEFVNHTKIGIKFGLTQADTTGSRRGRTRRIGPSRTARCFERSMSYTIGAASVMPHGRRWRAITIKPS